MSSSSFPVTKSPGTFIVPSEPTPTGVSLTLSPMDKIFPPSTFVEMILVFKQGGEDVVYKVREALAKALVPYHPLAGRMVRSESGEMGVSCTGDGVWFVEATADCSLRDLDGLAEPPLKIATEDLVSYPDNPAGMAVTLQMVVFDLFRAALNLSLKVRVLRSFCRRWRADSLGQRRKSTRVGGENQFSEFWISCRKHLSSEWHIFCVRTYFLANYICNYNFRKSSTFYLFKPRPENVSSSSEFGLQVSISRNPKISLALG